MRLRLAWVLFALGVIVAGCGGGGKVAFVPSTNAGSGGNAPTGAKTTRANIALYVPPANKQAASRKPFYISSNTQAFGVVVVPYPSTIPSPLPTTNLQIFPIATPSPCALASGGGETCNFTVTAPVGTDLFIVAAFATAAPNGNTTPLSAFVSGPVTVSLSPAPGATPLAFTLDGVVYSVAVTVASPDPGNTPNTQVFTVGVPTSAPVAVTAYDTTGNLVMSDPTAPYYNPIVIGASPAGNGVTLSLTTSSTCGSTASGASASIACAGDLNNLQVNYSGEATPDPSDHLVDAFVISATAQPNPSPSPANYVLASNILSYTLATGLGQIYDGYLQRTAGGAFIYLFEANDDEWYLGSFTPSTATSSGYAQLTTASDISSVAQGPSGTVWVDDYGPIDCYNSTGGAAIVSGLYPIDPSNSEPIYPVAIAIDSANNLWYVGYDDYGEDPPNMYAGYFNVASGCATPNPNPPVAQFALSGDMADYNASLAAMPGGGAVMATSYYYGFGVYAMTTGSMSPIGIIPPALASGLGYGVSVDSAGTTYAGFHSGSRADVETLASGGNTLSTLLDLAPTPAASSFPNPVPSGLEVFSPSSAADRAEYTDTNFEALGLVESLPASPMPILVSLPNSVDVFQAAYSAKGGEYVLDMDASENLNIVRAMPTKTWSVPNVSLNNGCGSNALLTILERGDSGPFTITNLPGTVTAMQLPGADHDFWLTVPYAGVSFTATVTDAHGRNETFSVTSAPSEITCGLAHRRLTKHHT